METYKMVLKPLLNKGHRFNRLEQRLFLLGFPTKEILGCYFFYFRYYYLGTHFML